MSLLIPKSYLRAGCHVLGWFGWKKKSFLTSFYFLGLKHDTWGIIFGFIVWFFFFFFLFCKPDKSCLFHWHEPETMSLSIVWNLAIPEVQRHALMEPLDEAQNASRYHIKCHFLPGGLVLPHCRCHLFQMPTLKEQDYILWFKVGRQFVRSQGPLDFEM